MLPFVRCSVDLVIRPRAALEAVLNHPRRVSFGFAGLLALAAVYAVVLSVAIANHRAPDEATLLLRIPAEKYYAYERLFLLPAAIAGTILAAGASRLTARLWNGRGSFEGLFALFGFTMLIVALFMGLPDLVIAIFAPEYTGTVHVWLVTAWYFVLSVLCVRLAERIPWGATIVSALAAMVATGVLQFLVMR